jgi:hypothetical protein
VEIRELVAGGAERLVALFAAVLPESPTANVDRFEEPEAFLRDSHSFAVGAHNETAQALYESLHGDRKPLGDVNFWWDLT